MTMEPLASGSVCFCSHVAFLFEGPPTLLFLRFRPGDAAGKGPPQPPHLSVLSLEGSVERHRVGVFHSGAAKDVQG